MSGYKKRSNLWVCVLYPDSLPEDYKKIIQGFHIPVLLSPVHDLDLNADETEKKKHIHMMIDYGAGQNKSYEQVCDMIRPLNCTIPIICHNRAAMVRYFVHKDNPEKHQYEVNDLEAFSGFEYLQCFENYTSELNVYKFIEDIIYNNMIYNYAVLVRYLSLKGYDYEGSFLRKHSMHFKNLMDGQFQLIQQGRQILVDQDSDLGKIIQFGEIDVLKKDK